MKEELLKNIESSAREVRAAKAHVMQKSEEIKAQLEEIEALQKSMTAAHDAGRLLRHELAALERKEFETSQRYSFYTAEALSNPY